MKAYLVGGAVRDRLLGIPVTEKDFVVLGETSESMIARGYRPVGNEFPVFLHPETHEEYALARTERKSGKGYHGFVIFADPNVTLEEDLKRRDLTINAMAVGDHGAIVDPYGGQNDLNRKLLRHVSQAFTEDPVRILRVARFAARFARLGFKIAAETYELMRTMVSSGEVDELIPERVWMETKKALSEPNPEAFFVVLRTCGALARIFPEISIVIEKLTFFQNGFESPFEALYEAAQLSEDPAIRFSSLVYNLGSNESDQLTTECSGINQLNHLCDRLKVPNNFRKLSEKVIRYHQAFFRSIDKSANDLVVLLMNLDAFRQPESFFSFLTVCEAISRSGAKPKNDPLPQASWLGLVLEKTLHISAKPLVEDGLKGAELGAALFERRVQAIQALEQERVAMRKQLIE